VELKVNFLEVRREGPYRVCGQVVRRGGRLIAAEGEARDASGETYSEGRGRVQHSRGLWLGSP